jgi:hypothetical protein
MMPKHAKIQFFTEAADTDCLLDILQQFNALESAQLRNKWRDDVTVCAKLILEAPGSIDAPLGELMNSVVLINTIDCLDNKNLLERALPLFFYSKENFVAAKPIIFRLGVTRVHEWQVPIRLKNATFSLTCLVWTT